MPVPCFGNIQKMSAGLCCQPICGEVIFPSSLPVKKGVKNVSFGMCYDLLLHFLFPGNEFMTSPQLSYFYLNQDLFSTCEEYAEVCDELIEKNDILDCFPAEDPCTFVEQEAIRHRILSLLELVESKTSTKTFSLPVLFGYSYWTLRSLCGYYSRLCLVGVVPDAVLHFFAKYIPLTYPSPSHSNASELGVFVTQLIRSKGYDLTKLGDLVAQKSLEIYPYMKEFKLLHGNSFENFTGGFEEYCRFVKFPNSSGEISKCSCKAYCVSSCVNVLLEVECTDETCVLGPSCGNRPSLSTAEPLVNVAKTEGKGWGLFAQESFPAEVFIAEYCGVVSMDRPAGDTSYTVELSAPSSKIPCIWMPKCLVLLQGSPTTAVMATVDLLLLEPTWRSPTLNVFICRAKEKLMLERN